VLTQIDVYNYGKYNERYNTILTPTCCLLSYNAVIGSILDFTATDTTKDTGKHNAQQKK
jgi:hypothetical protein